MVKILFLCPYFPYPLTRGSNIDMWGQIQYLADLGHDVHVVVLHSEAVAATHQFDYDNAANSEFEVSFINTGARWQVAESDAVLQQFQALIDAQNPDILWCAYADFAPLVRKVNYRDCYIVFRPINFELGHFIDKYGPANPYNFRAFRLKLYRWRLFLTRQWRTLWHIYQAERIMHQIADVLLYIGWRDMEVMRRLYASNATRLWVPPLLTSTQQIEAQGEAEINVVYLGSDMNNVNNLQGGRTFVDQIYPTVRDAFPDTFHFHVIGQHAQDHFASTESLTIHGFVDDLDTFMSQIDIVCVPNTAGWGIKLKVLDSLARGIPVIGAQAAFRGLQPTEDVYFSCESVADYLQAFASLRDASLRRRHAHKSADYYQHLKTMAQSRIQQVLSER